MPLTALEELAVGTSDRASTRLFIGFDDLVHLFLSARVRSVILGQREVEGVLEPARIHVWNVSKIAEI
jgi:hypothetical protein